MQKQKQIFHHYFIVHSIMLFSNSSKKLIWGSHDMSVFFHAEPRGENVRFFNWLDFSGMGNGSQFYDENKKNEKMCPLYYKDYSVYIATNIFQWL